MKNILRPTDVLEVSEIEAVWTDNKIELFKYAMTLTKSSDRAEDLLQATFLRLIHKVSQPYGYVWKNSVIRYLKRIMRNIYFNALRKQRNEEQAFSLFKEQRQVRLEIRAVFLRAARAVDESDSLTIRQKDVFDLRYLGRSKLTEIASEKGISLATTKRELHVSHSYLRRLADEGFFDLELNAHERTSIAGLGRKQET